MQYMSALYNKTMKSPARAPSSQEGAAEEHVFATKAFGPCEFRPVPGVSLKVHVEVALAPAALLVAAAEAAAAAAAASAAASAGVRLRLPCRVSHAAESIHSISGELHS